MVIILLVSIYSNSVYYYLSPGVSTPFPGAPPWSPSLCRYQALQPPRDLQPPATNTPSMLPRLALVHTWQKKRGDPLSIVIPQKYDLVVSISAKEQQF